MSFSNKVGEITDRLQRADLHPPDGGLLGAAILVALFTLWALMASGRPVTTARLLLSLAATESLLATLCFLQRRGLTLPTRRGDVEDLHITR